MGMHARTVVTLTVVLAKDLPVRLDLVRQGSGSAQRTETVSRNVRKIGKGFRETRRLLVEIDEEKALPLLHSHPQQRKVRPPKVV